MAVFFSLAAGLIFGLGLIASGMTDPSKVLGFLDLAGAWDPSLAFVMAAAVTIGAIAFGIARGWSASLLGLKMRIPTARHLDRRLIGGSILFGVGWGIAGLCPGPALVTVGMGEAKGVLFFAAMLAGMGLFELVERHGRSRRGAQA
ncbi:MAG TPA: DUF6691 family protein [Ramlibacter sp.]